MDILVHGRLSQWSVQKVKNVAGDRSWWRQSSFRFTERTNLKWGIEWHFDSCAHASVLPKSPKCTACKGSYNPFDQCWSFTVLETICTANRKTHYCTSKPRPSNTIMYKKGIIIINHRTWFEIFHSQLTKHGILRADHYIHLFSHTIFKGTLMKVLDETRCLRFWSKICHPKTSYFGITKTTNLFANKICLQFFI